MGKKFVGLDGLKHFWTKVKTWIAGQITSEVTAKIAEIVANAPEDLDTLKEIADWISTHANDAGAMNTQINTNKNDIAALQTSVAGKADTGHTHDDRYYTESEVDKKLAGKSNVEHTHTKSEITDFAHTHDDRYFTETEVTSKLAGKSDTGHKHSASDITSGTLPVGRGGTGATDAASGFNTLADGVRDSSKPADNEKMLLKPGGPWYKTTCLDFWNYINGKISFDLGLTKDNYGGKASTAGQADGATGITYIGGENDSCISAVQSPTSFNNSDANWASYIICNHGNGKTYYHQMLRLPFFSDTIQLQRRVNGELQGWKNVAIMENENTWSGRQNFTTAKASNKMVIPIGAPSQLEDGCIWIER